MPVRCRRSLYNEGRQGSWRRRERAALGASASQSWLPWGVGPYTGEATPAHRDQNPGVLTSNMHRWKERAAVHQNEANDVRGWLAKAMRPEEREFLRKMLRRPVKLARGRRGASLPIALLQTACGCAFELWTKYVHRVRDCFSF